MFWHNHFVTSTTFRLVGCEVAFYWWPIECGQPKRFFLFPRLVVAYQTYGHWRAFMSSFWPFCLRSLRSWATWSFEKVSKCYEKVDSVIISVYNPPLRGGGQFFSRLRGGIKFGLKTTQWIYPLHSTNFPVCFTSIMFVSGGFEAWLPWHGY